MSHGAQSFIDEHVATTFVLGADFGAAERAFGILLDDLDDDGASDLVATDALGSQISVFFNDGLGNFETKLSFDVGERLGTIGDEASPVSVQAADFLGGPAKDLVVANSGNDSFTVLENLGDGNFKSFTYDTRDTPWRLATGDLNGDDVCDLLVTFNSAGGGISIFMSDCVEPSPFQLNAIRGVQISGTFVDVYESDDSRITFQPGFVLNSSEPPVWLVAETVVNSGSSSLQFLIESHANTPNLFRTVEAWNWNTESYVVVSIDDESFGTDVISAVDLEPADYVDSTNGAVRSRIDWNRNGFVIVFPWAVSIDQLAWQAE